MNWTKDVPKVPGDYRWKSGVMKALVAVYKNSNGAMMCLVHGIIRSAEELGGEWCRLVPADEVEKAAFEIGNRIVELSNFDPVVFQIAWASSRAKRVMEGRE